jgi:transposase-like protein
MDFIHDDRQTLGQISASRASGCKRGKRWSTAARADCVRAWREEARQIHDLAAEYRVTTETIRRWSRQLDERGPTARGMRPSEPDPGFVALSLPETVSTDAIRIRSPDGWVVELPAQCAARSTWRNVVML